MSARKTSYRTIILTVAPIERATTSSSTDTNECVCSLQFCHATFDTNSFITETLLSACAKSKQANNNNLQQGTGIKTPDAINVLISLTQDSTPNVINYT